MSSSIRLVVEFPATIFTLNFLFRLCGWRFHFALTGVVAGIGLQIRLLIVVLDFYFGFEQLVTIKNKSERKMKNERTRDR